jgi:hypothetical protein
LKWSDTAVMVSHLKMNQDAMVNKAQRFVNK